MLENELTNEPNSEETADTAVAPRRRRRAASRPAGPPQGPETADGAPEIVLTPAAEPGEETEEAESPEVPEAGVVLVDAQPRRARRRATAPVASPAPTPAADDAEGPLTEPGAEDASACAVVADDQTEEQAGTQTGAAEVGRVVEEPAAPARRTRRRAASPVASPTAAEEAPQVAAAGPDGEAVAEEPPARRSRRRATAPVGSPAEAEQQAAPEAEPQPAKRSRRRKAEAVEADTPEVVEAVEEAPRRRTRRRAEAPVAAPEPETIAEVAAEQTAAVTPVEPQAAEAEAVEEAPRRRTRRRAEAPVAAPEPQPEPDAVETPEAEAPAPARRTRRRASAASPFAVTEAAPVAEEQPVAAEQADQAEAAETAEEQPAAGHRTRRRAVRPPTAVFQAPVFQEPTEVVVPVRPAAEQGAEVAAPEPAEAADAGADEDFGDDEGAAQSAGSRRRRRGGRRRRRAELEEAGTENAEAGAAAEPAEAGQQPAAAQIEAPAEEEEDEDDLAAALSSSSRRRRRRRRRSGEAPEAEAPVAEDDPERTVVKIREPRRKTAEAPFDPDEVQSIKGSTRLEAKKQRRREGREQGRRRVPIITEAEFLARREAVERVMVVRQYGERTQIGVLEDGVLVEHYVNKEQSTSYVGNVYLGKVQNVLPSMEAAFVDIGKGRNAVLYAGEVNFEALGQKNGPRRIESVLKSGQPVLVQVTKDPIGHKGARLTSQVSLPGRYLVYVPEGSMTGISRKLPDTERARLKQILKKIVPDDAGVIVRTAAEGASEEELTRDVQRLQQQWEDIQKKASTGNAPTLLYGEPDLTVRVVRDIFNEDFSKVIVSGDQAWETIHEYVSSVAPDLAPRLQRWTSDVDVFATYRIDEQLMKALDRKVWLPSGGSLVIDRTEAMVVVDVNTGKFTGQGGNLEETVTRNNLEAAEEIVRQLRLRDLGGIVVIDFIDMVLESNRDLVLRRLLECLGRDRTKHQVAEVTSLGLVQMTRKRVGQGLLESFSETCVHCNGRGVIVHMEQPPAQSGGGAGAAGKRRRRGRGGAETPAEAEALTVVDGEPLEPEQDVVEAVADGEAEPAHVHEEFEVVARDEPETEPAPAPARSRRRAVRKATAPAGPPSSQAESAAGVVVIPSRTADEAPAEAVAAGAPVPAAVTEQLPEAEAADLDAGAAAEPEADADAEPKKRTRKTAAKKTAAKKAAPAKKAAAKKAAAKKTAVKRAAKKAAAEPVESGAADAEQ